VATPQNQPPQRAAAPGAALSPARQAAQSALDAAHLQARQIRARAQACADLPSLQAAVAACTACGLCRTRTQTVFSDGDGRVPVMFIGEAPGANEDQQGVPFVGRAGALLTDIITKGMGLSRKDVVIANVLKCRPPDNRDPSEAEKILCTPWLDRQIELVNPKVLIPLGAHAAQHVLQVQGTIGTLRGRVHEQAGRKVVPTFHPAYLLRSPGEKAECWKDIQLAMSELGLRRSGQTAEQRSAE
jgi:DNA polymerase